MCDVLGIFIKLEKIECLVIILDFLGIKLDICFMEVVLFDEKIYIIKLVLEV